jgi:hypothetical protein
MSRGKIGLATILAIFSIIILSPSAITPNAVVSAAPNSPYVGIGDTIEVYEFVRNDSITFLNGQNDTAFTYDAGWFPGNYRGYRLYSSVSNLRRVTDPVPNGDFENITGFSDTWNLTQSEGLINSISNVTGGNPGYCMDMELAYTKVNKQAIAYVDNIFNYTSTFDPDTLDLYFDVKFSGDVTQQSWLVLKVSVEDEGGNPLGSWSDNLADNHEPDWHTYTFPTSPVNGLVRLRITLDKRTSSNEDVQGHIYFDNFRYEIGSIVQPSEVDLTLNSTPFVDTISNAGEVSVYADSTLKEETPWINCWSTSQLFEFNTTFDNISFSYTFSMYVKQVSSVFATTDFSAPVDESPVWQVNYTIPSTGPGGDFVGYTFGLNLRNGWTKISVTEGGTPVTHSYNETTRFVKIEEGVAGTGETYTVAASSSNYVLSVVTQKGPTAGGPWTDVYPGGYFVKDEYIRVKADLLSIGPLNNFANVSIFYPNNSMIWRSADSSGGVTIDDVSDTLTSPAWQIESPAEVDIGLSWLVTVSFDNQTQCGMSQTTFIVVVDTQPTEITPAQHSDHIWGETIPVNVTWQNAETGSYITDATAQIRYVDRNSQTRIVPMIPNTQGAYELDFSTNLMSPDRNAEFYVELFYYGYVNASFDQGTHITFTVNLVNDLELVMIRPTQLTGPNEYTGETTQSQGYLSQVKFYDPFRSAYVLNESSFWPAVRVNYDYYEDTGSGFGSPLESSHFGHNTTDRTFSKYDASYLAGVQAVKYVVSMQVDLASWDFTPLNFTIIINIVLHATNLDAVQTQIMYPPDGSGWTEYNPASDNYVTHLYWDEILNVTVYYENTSDPIPSPLPGATVNIYENDTLLSAMSPIVGQPGYYTYDIDTALLRIGLNKIYVNAWYSNHANQTILVTVFVENRLTTLSRNHTSSSYITPWGTNFVLQFSYSDNVTGSLQGIDDIIPYVEYDGLTGNYSVVNNNGGVYTITFNGLDVEATYYLTVFFEKTNYTTRTQYYEFTIRPVFTQSFGAAIPSSIPWGDFVNITLQYEDLDNFKLIAGADVTVDWQGNTLGVDYWIIDNLDGTYTVLLNTTLLPTGTNNYLLQIDLAKDHYQLATATISFQVRDIQTILYIANYEPSTSVPWNDTLTIYLQFNNTDVIPSELITNADITCDWDAFYWSISYSGAHNAYLLVIQTRSRSEGSYAVSIFASKAHYISRITQHNFVIRVIRTGTSATPQYVPTHPRGENISITVQYFDLDHPGTWLPYAELFVDWNASYYTIIDLLNGTYVIELNTTCRGIGPHDILITATLLPHYENQSVPVTIVFTTIPIYVEVLEPSTGQYSVDYNTLVTITVNVTNYQGLPVNDVNVTYQWAGRNAIPLAFLGNGIYSTSFFANASLYYNHQITIQAIEETKYTPGLGVVLLLILPIDTALDYVDSGDYNTVVGESFEISVNFTTIDGLPINEANVTFSMIDGSRNGSLLNIGPGIYSISLDITGLAAGRYPIFVSASKATLREQVLTLYVNIERIPVAIIGLPLSIEVLAGTQFDIIIVLNDTYHGSYITDAIVNITIAQLNIISEPMFNHQNGTYSLTGIIAPLFPGSSPIIIEIRQSQFYEYAREESSLVVRENEAFAGIMTYVAIGAVIGIIFLILWLAYVRIFSVPWMVRKMRKMSQSIGKGDVPAISKIDHTRISGRTELMSDIANPYYESIGLTATTIVMPAEIEWEEKEAEDEAIWSELKGLPILEYEQKLELFQQMKQIAPSERVWFIEDLRKQMADGTRFARKPKEPEVSEDVEKELQARLATFPALSNIEKARIAAQLRKMPKEDWDEIFHTLAIAEQPVAVTVEDELAPDEFPSLTEEERQKVLEEIKDLTPEERQKVLKTLREKQDEKTPKGKLVKGKKEFVVDDSKDE